MLSLTTHNIPYEKLLEITVMETLISIRLTLPANQIDWMLSWGRQTLCTISYRNKTKKKWPQNPISLWQTFTQTIPIGISDGTAYRISTFVSLSWVTWITFQRLRTRNGVHSKSWPRSNRPFWRWKSLVARLSAVQS